MVPAILEYLPYRWGDATYARDYCRHPYVCGHGFACVRVDLRGSGDSEGVVIVRPCGGLKTLEMYDARLHCLIR
eukprot:COSAG01_NODE_9528_length_2418_cov_2.092281_3_plen_74_part_00